MKHLATSGLSKINKTRQRRHRAQDQKHVCETRLWNMHACPSQTNFN